jgi:hypothetical protein
MQNWEVIRKLSLRVGIAFLVFAGLAALTNYELNKVMYTSAAPASLFVYNIFTSILPYLLGAVISFVVVSLSSHEEASAAEKETEIQKEETKEAQKEPTPEDVFKETPN